MKISVSKVVSIILVSILLVSCTKDESELIEHSARDDVVGVNDEDPEMTAAQEKARETLGQFVTALQNKDGSKRYLLKVELAEGDEIEHVWLEPIRWANPGLEGVLAVEPVAITKFKKGDVVRPAPNQISDWIILNEDGTQVGGYTARVIEGRKDHK